MSYENGDGDDEDDADRSRDDDGSAAGVIAAGWDAAGSVHGCVP